MKKVKHPRPTKSPLKPFLTEYSSNRRNIAAIESFFNRLAIRLEISVAEAVMFDGIISRLKKANEKRYKNKKLVLQLQGLYPMQGDFKSDYSKEPN